MISIIIGLIIGYIYFLQKTKPRAACIGPDCTVYTTESILSMTLGIAIITFVAVYVIGSLLERRSKF